MFDLILLCVAGFAAGALNAVAGGGTFLSLPALIFVGVPPVAANATSTLVALPGYISSAWGFRDDMKAEGALSLRAIALVGAIGGLLGSLLLIVTPGDMFLGVVPWLMLLATILFAFGPSLLKMLQQGAAKPVGAAVAAAIIGAVSVYGGYFNGGLGIIMLAAFGVIGYTNLHGMNGLKNVLAALLSLVSAVTFITAGLIAWEQAVPMAISATIGGYLGARLSRQITRTEILRYFVIAVGIVMTVVFFLR